MKLIAVSGLKGGVGASTVAANLAGGLHDLNKKIAIVDLDLRNFLRVYFSMKMTDGDGWASREYCGEDWALAFHQSPAGVSFLPFGAQAKPVLSGREKSISKQRKVDFFSDPKSVYRLSNSFFSEMLTTLADQFDYAVIHLPSVSFTSSFMEHLRELHATIDLHLVVVNPDTACYSILDAQGISVSQLSKIKLLANKFYSTSEVSSDFSFYMKKIWGETLISSPIHFDEALAEATANLQTVNCYSPGSLAAAEFKTLALWSISALGSNEGSYA